MRLTQFFVDFFESEKSGGLLLIICTIISLILANTAFAENYLAVWNINLASHTLIHWINDGLMAIFFLLVGLELERELYAGELSDFKKASLPFVCAVGGMFVPASVYLIFNYGTSTQSGAGIPMATDIAFAIGILSLLGTRVPVALKVLLTALAVIDDLGAILIIAFFYSGEIFYSNLGISLGIFALLLVCNRLKVHNLLPYMIGGVAMWYFMLNSGIHATITGVMLAFAIPFGDGTRKTLSYRVQKFLHKPVAIFILPLFALANTCLVFSPGSFDSLFTGNSIGIISGLAIGKPLGIFMFGLIAVLTGICVLPEKTTWSNLLAVGFLGGIGFTMSIFISLLAFDDQQLIDQSKMAILVASLISGVIGYVYLYATLPTKTDLESGK